MSAGAILNNGQRIPRKRTKPAAHAVKGTRRAVTTPRDGKRRGCVSRFLRETMTLAASRRQQR